MPDPGMPYYDPTQNQFGMIPQQQPMQYSMPDQSMGYNSYAANNQYLMNNQQSQFQQTVQIAQNNFHQHMQTVLQGTMAAGMAIYNTGKSVVDKSREHLYQDMLVGESNNYVLERSFWREAAWGTGLAGSSLGRTLKIGGRTPEFVSQEELDYQMSRTWGHRKEEILYGLVGGGTSMGSSMLGMRLGKNLGMVKSIGMGFGLDYLIGGAVEQWVAPRQNRLDFRKFTENMDLNQTVGQRRLSSEVSDQLADRFFYEDRQQGWRAIPIFGDILADRLGPSTKRGEFTKKMMSAGLFRDQDLNDVDKMESHVRETIKVVEKFAGLAHTTKDAILNIKATLNKFGINDASQNQTISNLTATSINTGIDMNTLVGQIVAPAMQLGLGTGYDKSIVGNRAVKDVAALKAMQEAGLLDRMYDPGSLSAQNLNAAVNFGKTGFGMVTRFGNGNIETARSYFSRNGSGNTAVGMMFDGLPGFIAGDDPIETYRSGVKNVVNKFGGGKRGIAVALSMAKTQEEKIQIMNAAYGTDVRSEHLSASTTELNRALATGNYSNISTFDATKVGGSLHRDINAPEQFLLNLSDKLQNVKEVTTSEDGDKKSHDYLSFGRMYSKDLQALKEAALSGDIKKYNEIKEEITYQAVKRHGHATEDNIDLMIHGNLKKIGGKEISKTAKAVFEVASGSDFLKGRHKNISLGLLYMPKKQLAYLRGKTSLEFSEDDAEVTVTHGYRNSDTEDIYKVADKLFQNKALLDKAISGMTDKNAKTFMSDLLLEGGFKVGSKEYNIMMGAGSHIVHDTVYDSYQQLTRAKDLEALTRKFATLQKDDKNNIYKSQKEYTDRAIAYGSDFTKFKTMLSSNNLNAIRSMLKHSDKLDRELSYLDGYDSKQWQHLQHIASSGGSEQQIIEELKKESETLKTVTGTEGKNGAAGTGTDDPNTQMIKSFTEALNKLVAVL